MQYLTEMSIYFLKEGMNMCCTFHAAFTQGWDSSDLDCTWMDLSPGCEFISCLFHVLLFILGLMSYYGMFFSL